MIGVGLNPREVGGGAAIMMMPPAGMENCTPLPVVHQVYGDGSQALLSHWTFTPAERAAIANGADILLYVVGGEQPPVALEIITTEDN